jgi:hypothetical protein
VALQYIEYNSINGAYKPVPNPAVTMPVAMNLGRLPSFKNSELVPVINDPLAKSSST